MLEWFKREGDDRESRLLAALHLYVETHKAYQET
jgi:hypothetical protein